jgi:hypothetical protein
VTHRRGALPFTLWSSILLVAAGAAVLGWALWPLPFKQETIALGSLSGLLPEPLTTSATGPRYNLHLTYPRTLRMGSRFNIAAVLEPDGAMSESSLPANSNVVAVAHIQSNDVLLDPNGDIMDPLPASGRASFAWWAAPLRDGMLEATLFVRLEVVPQEGGVVTAQTIFARTLPMRGAALLGLTATSATALGVAALLTGGVLLLGAVLGRPPRKETSQ